MRWKDYIRNRVAAIQKASWLLSAYWRYIPSKENPADCESRGLSASEIERHLLWYLDHHGYAISDIWSKLNPNFSIANEDLEERSRHIFVSIQISETPSSGICKTLLLA